MNTSRKNQSGPEKLITSDDHKKLLRDDICSDVCPSLSYESVISTDGDNRVNKAFDILFQEVMRIRKLNKPHEINSHIRQGVNSPAGRGANS
jgi:hypothetical protein